MTKHTGLPLRRADCCCFWFSVLVEFDTRCVHAVYGVACLQAYAMTEASHQMTSNPLPKHGPHKPGTVGRAQGSVKVRTLLRPPLTSLCCHLLADAHIILLCAELTVQESLHLVQCDAMQRHALQRMSTSWPPLTSCLYRWPPLTSTTEQWPLARLGRCASRAPMSPRATSIALRLMRKPLQV